VFLRAFVLISAANTAFTAVCTMILNLDETLTKQ
jgi:hypothetical protein